MKLLAIGNSFSEDACRWLHDLAVAAGVDLEVYDMSIGGCSLERHWNNVVNDIPDYGLDINGILIREEGLHLEEMLKSEKWDVISIQQASHFSGKYSTYMPYLAKFAAYLRKTCPGAALWIHETWAYETDTGHPAFKNYGSDQGKMYTALKEAYTLAAAEINAAGVFRSGDVIEALRTVPGFIHANGEQPLHLSDGFHLSHPYGRYAAACVWLRSLFGVQVSGLDCYPEEDGVKADPALIALIQKTVDDVIR